MLNLLRKTLVMVATTSFFSFAWAAENKPGGQGFIEREYGQLNSGAEIKCFYVEKGSIASVCAKYRINWKLWSLMGEPVGDYNLAWTLININLRDPITGEKVTYSNVESLPKQLQNSARALELYIDGVASINNPTEYLEYRVSGSSIYGYHAFNTGVAVRADVGSSMNVPGSPSWGTLFIKGPECNDKKQSYMDANDAKAAFKQGVVLQSLTICPKSSVSGIGSLESDIKELCKGFGADKTYRFCPEQKVRKEKAVEMNAIDDAFATLEEKAADTPVLKAGSIDDAFAQMEASQIEKERLRVAAIKEKQDKEAKELEDKIRREEAVQFCMVAMKSEKSCLQDACNYKPSETICTDNREDPRPIREPQPYDDSKSNTWHIVFPTYTCYATGINPAYSVWKSCAKSMASQCARDGKKPTSLDECIAQRVESTD